MLFGSSPYRLFFWTTANVFSVLSIMLPGINMYNNTVFKERAIEKYYCRREYTAAMLIMGFRARKLDSGLLQKQLLVWVLGCACLVASSWEMGQRSVKVYDTYTAIEFYLRCHICKSWACVLIYFVAGGVVGWLDTFLAMPWLLQGQAFSASACPFSVGHAQHEKHAVPLLRKHWSAHTKGAERNPTTTYIFRQRESCYGEGYAFVIRMVDMSPCFQRTMYNIIDSEVLAGWGALFYSISFILGVYFPQQT